jgi:U3 small nucleolar RNA-associated protein 13
MMICREQDLQNYLLKKDYLNAILLAMSLEQPFRLLTLFDTVLNERPEGDTSISGSEAIDKILKDMNAEQINKLLGYIRDWNTNAKRSRVAQTILNTILTLHSSEELVELSNAKEVRCTYHKCRVVYHKLPSN